MPYCPAVTVRIHFINRYNLAKGQLRSLLLGLLSKRLSFFRAVNSMKADFFSPTLVHDGNGVSIKNANYISSERISESIIAAQSYKQQGPKMQGELFLRKKGSVIPAGFPSTSSKERSELCSQIAKADFFERAAHSSKKLPSHGASGSWTVRLCLDVALWATTNIDTGEFRVIFSGRYGIVSMGN